MRRTREIVIAFTLLALLAVFCGWCLSRVGGYGDRSAVQTQDVFLA